MALLRYADARPAELEAHLSSSPVAVVPFGALEWHGPHLPLGLDGIVAEAFCESLAERLNAVLLPTVWHPVTTLPHRLSLDVPTEVFRSLVQAMTIGLERAGARTLCLVTGHYAHGHHMELYRSADRAMELLGGLRAFAATPLEPLGDAKLLDHAARYETSQLLAVRPELVDIGNLPESTQPKAHAVLGEHPKWATAQEGIELFARALDAWESWVSSADQEALFAHYADAKDAYAAYVRDYYRDSWEQAIHAWWETM